MGKWFTTNIDLEYNPNITLDKMAEVLRTHFPQYPVVEPWYWKGRFIALKKRAHAIVSVGVKHNENKNRTRIRITGGMLPIGTIYAGAIWYSVSIGDLPEQVEAVIRQELPNLIVG